MKLTIESAAGPLHVIRGYGAEGVLIGERRLRSSLIVGADQLIEDWRPVTLEELQAEDFAPVLALRPELVLLGTGVRQRFPAPAVLAPLHAARVGVEVMDTGAACRTYNVLLGEGRRVVAALLQSP